MNDAYPVGFSVDYPERDPDRLTTAFRIFTIIPIAIVLGTIGGYSTTWEGASGSATTVAVGGTGLLFLPPLLMIVFREKYPRWWYDWNRELLRFMNRVCVYLVLMETAIRRPTTSRPSTWTSRTRTLERVSTAGTTGSSGTPSSWSPIATRPSGWTPEERPDGLRSGPYSLRQ